MTDSMSPPRGVPDPEPDCGRPEPDPGRPEPGLPTPGPPEPDPGLPEPTGPRDLTGPSGVCGEPVGGWDRVRVIAALRSAAAREREAEVDQYALIAAAADVYAWVDNFDDYGEIMNGRSPRVLHGERLWRFGADGTPEVAEFLTFEVGPALGISPDSAAGLIADVLDLRHRLPRTWQLVLQGRVLGWLARRIAQTTRPLAPEITGELDRHLAPFLAGWTPRQTLLRVAMLIARLDPEGTEERRRHAVADRFVAIEQGESGTATVRGQVDGPAGQALDNTLDELADVLAAGGMDGTTRELRAAAMEVLADPTYAADLLNGVIAHLPSDDHTDLHEDTDRHDHTTVDDVSSHNARGGAALGDDAPGSSNGGAGPVNDPDGGSGAAAALDLPGAGAQPLRGHGARDPNAAPTTFGSPWRLGTLNLDLHLHLADLIRGAGGESAQLGELALSQIRDLIARAGKVVITPVLDPLAPQEVEGYEVPDRIARAIKLRNPTVVFPFSNRSSTSRHVQCDHVIPHPQGPTHSDNLAPLDPRAHRVKTFGGYRKVTLRPGVYEWTTPTGQHYWVTPHGTHHTNPDTTPPPRRTRLADRARDALQRGTPTHSQDHGDAPPAKRIRDQLPPHSLQPELIPDPDPRPLWKGTMKPPDFPEPPTEPPPF